MSRFIATVLALFLGFGPTIKSQVNDVKNQVVETQSMVTLELTKLEVNEARLDLHFRIENYSDQYVWVLDNLFGNDPPLEVFLSKNGRTLLLRRRLAVPTGGSFAQPMKGRYMLFRPGETRAERVSIALPVVPRFKFARDDVMRTYTGEVRHIRLEIGYYDQDLPALVDSVLREAEKFEGTFEAAHSVKLEYFRGLAVRGLARFHSLDPDPYTEGFFIVAYTRGIFTGEKVLSLEVDGVSIPYDGFVEAQLEVP